VLVVAAGDVCQMDCHMMMVMVCMGAASVATSLFVVVVSYMVKVIDCAAALFVDHCRIVVNSWALGNMLRQHCSARYLHHHQSCNWPGNRVSHLLLLPTLLLVVYFPVLFHHHLPCCVDDVASWNFYTI
jgi:hypothetical protein